ncbi:hypothetical protein V502_09088 [Pseudogymnoascus sp. VKM F-4520 (FW-2644)]|nr:hypothetical protein V502_09088 [Pseudogymnoascus sp. VKM F-4520 (FW-2644)]
MASSEGPASLSPKAYVKLQTPHKFFKVGRVFQSDSKLIYVVVREGYSSSTCCELRFLGQSNNIDRNLPNIATLSLPDSPTKTSDGQYQLILECPLDEVLPLYYFDYSKWLVVSHQSQVYKIGRVDRKSIKSLEATFAAASTPFDTVTSTTVESTGTQTTEMESTGTQTTEMGSTEMGSTEMESTEMESTEMKSTEMETSSLRTPALYSKPSSTNEATSPAEINHAMISGHKMNRRSKRTGPTKWSPWEYNMDRRAYVTFRINKYGKKEYQLGSECSPPPEGLVEGSDDASSTSYELQLKGEEEISQERNIFMALGTSEKPSPQCATMAAVDNSRYMHYGIPGYYGYGGLPVTTSPPNTASLSVSTDHPSTSLPSRYPTFGYYVPQLENAELALSHTSKSLIDAPTNQDFGGRQTGTDKLPPKPLWKEFQIRSSSDFKPGHARVPFLLVLRILIAWLQILKVVWTEPEGHSRSRQKEKANFQVTGPSKYGERAYTSIRRFIIIKSYEGHSTCLPILTYGHRGTAKPGVKPDHHAIIYSRGRLSSMVSEEQELVNEPIRIEMNSPRHTLDSMSRINYAKIYTVEHNVMVSFIGRVHADSFRTLKGDYLKINHIFLHDDADDPSRRDDAAPTKDTAATIDNDVTPSEGQRDT